MPEDLLVVIVAYGDERHLRTCLDALGPGFRIVVVDNGRSETARAIATTFETTYLRPDSNLGFAAAVNLGLSERNDGSDVLLLNPDARLHPSDIQRLSSGLHLAEDIAAVGPRLQDPEGNSERSVWPIPSPWIALATVVGVETRVSRRSFINGAVLLLRGSAIDAVGRFDEQFFLYSEEADWQLRAIQAHWRVIVVEDAFAVHVGGGTSDSHIRRELLFNASAERFIRKWYGPLGWLVFRCASILTAVRRLLTSPAGPSRATQRSLIAQYLRGPVRSLEAGRESE